MHTLKVVVSLPDAEHPAMEVRLSSDDADGDVVIELASRRPAANAPARPTVDDDYVLGGYAGI